MSTIAFSNWLTKVDWLKGPNENGWWLVQDEHGFRPIRISDHENVRGYLGETWVRLPVENVSRLQRGLGNLNLRCVVTFPGGGQ